MRAGKGSVVARETELALVERFIHDIRDGPAALVLAGHAGIGKTAIWNHARTTPTPPESGPYVSVHRVGSGLAFAGLGDLLDGLGAEVLAALPEVQQRALSAALLFCPRRTPAGRRRRSGSARRAPRPCADGAPPARRRRRPVARQQLAQRPVVRPATADRRTGAADHVVPFGPLGGTGDAADLGLPGGAARSSGRSASARCSASLRRGSTQTLARPTLTRLHRPPAATR